MVARLWSCVCGFVFVDFIWQTIWLRSRGAHCDRILAVEVQRCTLRSGAGQTRSAKQIGDEDWRGGGGGGGGGGRTTVIKSNNPHLAGGELRQSLEVSLHSRLEYEKGVDAFSCVFRLRVSPFVCRRSPLVPRPASLARSCGRLMVSA